MKNAFREKLERNYRKERRNMSRGQHYNHKKKGHPGNLPKNSVTEGKDHIQYGKPIENIIPEEAFKNRVNEE